VTHLVEWQVGDDPTQTLLVEVDEPSGDDSGEVRAALGWKRTKAPETLDAALERIKPGATTLLSKVRDLSDPPDEASIQFGIKLTASAGAVLASAGVEANYSVTLTWRRKG
jgi:hypothetical protein